MKKMVIVGGGIHGTYLLLSLIRRFGVTPDEVQLIDLHAMPLANWKHCTHNIEMQMLRSTRGHHLGLRSDALLRFSERESAHFSKADFGSAPYAQPSLRLFQAHTEDLIKKHQLTDYWKQDRVTGFSMTSSSVTVQTDQSFVEAEKLVLAIGRTEQNHWPDWAQKSPSATHIAHIYSPSFRREAMSFSKHVVIVGGGIGAVQMALACTKRSEKVVLLTREPLKEAWFDTDPGWVGPKFMRAFLEQKDWVVRRKMIEKARLTGTIPPPLALHFQDKLHLLKPRLSCVVGEVESSANSHSGSFANSTLILTDGSEIETEQILLATGFSSERPGQGWLDKAIKENRLSCAPCGYPVLSDSLEWVPRLFVMGPLAELELGPTAGNIVGARRGAMRMIQAVQSSFSNEETPICSSFRS